MKRFGATMKIALRALRRNKLRTLLTMLGIICGVAAVIWSVSLTSGAKAQVEAQIARLGQNVILIFSGSFTRGGVHSGWGGAGTLSVDDADAIQREIPGVTVVSPEVRTTTQIAAGNQNWSTQILGESADYFTLRSWPVHEGAGFSEQDVREEITSEGRTTIPHRIASLIKERMCACEERNPSGACCLGEVARAVKRLMQEVR